MFQKSLKKSNKIGNNKKGFTLIELVVVIAIIAILTAIAVPMFANAQKKARETADQANQRVLKGAAAMYLAEKGVPTTEVVWISSSTDALQYVEEWPDKPYEYTVTIKTDGTIEVTTISN